MVDSWYCLDQFVPEGISQVSRRSEVGYTKRRSLNTRLSSGTSAGTFAVSSGPYRNYHSRAGTKNEPWHVFGTIPKKGLENRSSRIEPKNPWLSFSRGPGPPLRPGLKGFDASSWYGQLRRSRFCGLLPTTQETYDLNLSTCTSAFFHYHTSAHWRSSLIFLLVFQ